MIFQPSSIPLEGKRVRGVLVSCGYCAASRALPVNTFTGSHSDQDAQHDAFVKRKLEASGWLVGKTDTQHRCPGCYSKIKVAQKRKCEAKGEQVVRDSNSSVEVRQMLREDRRIVISKLQDVYLDEKTGYAPGWTDSKVASDLGVPRAWVKQMRDENFGPEGANEDIRQAVSAGHSLLSEIKAVRESIAPHFELLSSIADRANKIEKTLIDIAKALR